MDHIGRAKRSPDDQKLFALLDELDRLEGLLDEMQELGVTTIEEIDERISALNAEVDALTGEDDSGD